MPFKSEKQRRFLWSQHPDIAKRWAKEYPGQKDLPLYAHKKKPDDKEKAAAMDNINKAFAVNTIGLTIYNECVKKANSGLLKVDIPHSDKPVAAGDEHVTAENAGEDKASPIQTRNEDEVNQSSEELAGETVNSDVNSLLKKLAVVLSQPIMQAIENEKAEQQARMAAKMPQNVGIKRYAMPVNTTPMPMGMQQPAQPAQPQQPQAAQPAQAQGAGMNSPSANPINSFGALSASGNINGNAAFGTKNSPDSSKTAASSPAWQRSAGKNDEGGLNEKGRKSYEREHGGNLKAPVTESNPSGDRAKRQNSFCSRMCGMKSVNTGAATAKDPDSRINKSLRKWNCKCSALMLAKTAFDPTLGAAIAGGGLLTAGGLGAAYMFGGGPNSRKGRQYPKDRMHYATLPDGTKIYRQNEREEEFDDGLHARQVADFVNEKGEKADAFQIGAQLSPAAIKAMQQKYGAASQLYKAARPLGLDNYSSFAGPDQIQHAVQQYGQLKALVRPDDNTLRARGLNRDGFQSSLRHIVRNSQGQDKYNLSDMAPDPKMYAAGAGALGLLGTAGLGYLGGMDGAGVGLAGTGAGVAAAYMHAANKRKNILNTAKLMKEYGLLKPKTLAHAYPLLSDDHKFASAEEFVSKAAELAVARKN
jgi:hypothetical protein